MGNSVLRTLFDTGSRYNVLCVSAHKEIGEPPLNTTPMIFVVLVLPRRERVAR